MVKVSFSLRSPVLCFNTAAKTHHEWPWNSDFTANSNSCSSSEVELLSTFVISALIKTCSAAPPCQKATSSISRWNKCSVEKHWSWATCLCVNGPWHIKNDVSLRSQLVFFSNCVLLNHLHLCVFVRQRDKWRAPHDFTKRFPVWTWALRGLLWQIGLLPLFTLQP